MYYQHFYDYARRDPNKRRDPKDPNKKAWIPLDTFEPMYMGDHLRDANGSLAHLIFGDHWEKSLAPSDWVRPTDALTLFFYPPRSVQRTIDDWISSRRPSKTGISSHLCE